MKTIQIGARSIGEGHPTYVVAELSANHRQNFDEAVKLVEAAKMVGADAVKLQTYRPDTLTIASDKPYFRVETGTLWDGRNLYDLYSEAYTPWDWQPKLRDVARRLDIDLFSTPFDVTAVEFLEKMEVPAYKIASFELVDLPLITRVARTGRPLIMSTGMATLAEIDDAVRTAREAGCEALALLKCTSAYPAPPEEANLRTLSHLSSSFDAPVGLSDHTLGIAVPVVAVALGATIIEKHFTLSRSVPGPDSAFSLEPEEFASMVEAIRIAERAVGAISYQVTNREAQSRRYRRSLFIVEDIRSGELFTEQNLRSIRPADGLAPKHLGEVLGRRAAAHIERGTPLSWDLIA